MSKDLEVNDVFFKNIYILKQKRVFSMQSSQIEWCNQGRWGKWNM